MSTRTIALPEATAHECSPQHTGPSQWTDHRLREQKGPTWIFIVLSGMIFRFSPFRNSISISGFCGLRGQSRCLPNEHLWVRVRVVRMLCCVHVRTSVCACAQAERPKMQNTIKAAANPHGTDSRLISTHYDQVRLVVKHFNVDFAFGVGFLGLLRLQSMDKLPVDCAGLPMVSTCTEPRQGGNAAP